MHIVHIASELAPIAKVGGLADVVMGLSRELSWKGHDVDIIIPKYDSMDSDHVRDLAIDTQDLPSFYRGEWFSNTIWIGWVENLKVYFIEPHHPRCFFSRGCVYGCEDDLERFLYFSRVAIEFVYKKGLQPHVIHFHDWQTSFIGPLVKYMYSRLGINRCQMVFTIHNLQYQGVCRWEDLEGIGFERGWFQGEETIADTLQPELVNGMKGAIICSGQVTTVSPTYAREALTSAGGLGLEDTLRKFQFKFRGILNGVDYSYWNPEIDRYLPAHYSTRELPLNKKDRATLDKKGFLKKQLRDRLDLLEEHRPIVSCIARLVPQKGLELIRYAIEHIEEMQGQFVLLGSSPIPQVSSEFHALKHRYADHPHVHIGLHHQEDLAHLIYAGSDLFIVPSIFEPCGLTQLIALKYGAIPVVRRTGGLADTIYDVADPTIPEEKRNGFVFDPYDAHEFDLSLRRAICTWFDVPDQWKQLMVRAMSTDFSWNHPADEYLEVYRAKS